MAYQGVPPLRQDPFTAEPATDGLRVKYALELWDGQTQALLRRDRQVEENVRMLAGQHWTAWNVWLQKWQDVTEWMTDDERRWRQRPVINRLLYWFILTHARLTENPPTFTFQPENDARMSAELAEVMDTIFKGQWRETGMTEVFDRLIAWLIPGGRAHLQSVFDGSLGPFRDMSGPAMLPILGPDGQPMMDPDSGAPLQGMATKVPYAPHPDTGEMTPQAHLDADGNLVQTGPALQMREGGLRIDVLSTLQVRGSWGPTPWHFKPWHMSRHFLTPDEVHDLTGVDDDGEAIGQNMRDGDPGYLNRMIFGSGFYGAAGGKPGAEFTSFPKAERLVECYALWQKPCNFEGMQEAKDQPGGRYLLVTRKSMKVLRDGARPIAFPFTSAIRSFDFVNLPGRPGGTSPQEMLNPLNRTSNRLTAQILENANLIANPVGIMDISMADVEVTNKPGERYVVQKRPGITPFEYVTPPSIGRDVYEAQTLLRHDFDTLGHLEGAEGSPPTMDASGKLVKELRFNSDRFLGPTARRNVEELARMALDWKAILKVAWDEERVIAYLGDDNVTRTVTVYPEMFEDGSVRVIPDVESMLPQSRSERQQQVFQIWQSGAWGDPMSPAAAQKYLELARFPHIGRTAWPGGMDVVMAQNENGQLVRGAAWEDVPVMDWQDDAMHLQVHEHFMKSPQYMRMQPTIQQNFAAHRELHLRAQAAKMMRQEVQAQQMAAGVAVSAAKHAAAVGQHVGPPAPGKPMNPGDDTGPAAPPAASEVA